MKPVFFYAKFLQGFFRALLFRDYPSRVHHRLGRKSQEDIMKEEENQTEGWLNCV